MLEFRLISANNNTIAMNSPDPACRYVRNPDLISTDMDGDTVMMSIARGEYFGLSGVGNRIWALLEQPVAIADLHATICTEFEVDAATCNADLQAFLAQLIENDLIHAA